MIARFALFLFIVFSVNASAQKDTLIFVDKRPKKIISYRIENDTVFYQKKKDGKWKSIEKRRVIGVSRANGLFDTISFLNKLLIINHNHKLITSYDIKGDSLFYHRASDNRRRWIERDRVFGVLQPSGFLDTLYLVDTLENNWRSAAEMAEYIQGQTDALNHYGKRTVPGALGGLLVGGLSSGAGLLYGPFGMLIYTGLVGFTPAAHKQRLGFNPWCVDSEPYVEGYNTAAKRKAVRRAALCAGIGYATGVIVLTVVLP